ncbi:MAG: single-stranded DNA-binding protein [Candidatus Eisenbacteria bacterium]|jgi:single-strand DNA-binding protein|nr:single-stranded DNA-binding protein [Candidatus Eisenbacteria bacterium]
MSLNKVILLGRLGRDPEIRYTQSQLTIANLNIATDERRPDGNGGWKQETEWHRVVLFGKQADLAKQYLTKGREVLIEGSLRTRQWQDQQGQKRYSTEIVAQNMRFVGGRGGAGGPGGGGGFDRGQDDFGGAPVGADTGGMDDFGGAPDDDIPF